MITYYGLLQGLHLLVLIRAGAIMLLEGRFPFPVLPPPSGWADGAIPFMLGLGATDVIGILLGITFVYQSLFKNRMDYRLGVISLTIFITGAIIFAFGTFPSGAWAAHPIAYWTMVILFLPTLVLYIWLLRSYLKPGSRQNSV